MLHPEWFAKDTIRVLVQLSTKGHADLNRRDVPRAGDFARNEDDRKVIELVFSQGIFGRPYVLPPGVPPDRVAALRKAFVAALNDKSLRAEADKMQLDVDPMAGDELQKLVADLYATPPHLIERARQALTAKPSRQSRSGDDRAPDNPARRLSDGRHWSRSSLHGGGGRQGLRHADGAASADVS